MGVIRISMIGAALCVAGATAVVDPATVSAQDTPAPSLVADYPVFEPITPPGAYQRAVANGTRTESGRPGPSYWQQSVEYRIEARLDPSVERIEGTETVRYTNNSPAVMNGVLVRLYQNVFAPGVERNRRVQLTGGMRLERVAVGEQVLERITSASFTGEGTPAGYLIDGTLVRVFLPEPIASGGTVELELDWRFQVPGAWAFRTGHIESEVFNIAQWYPQIGVVDDVFGYDEDPYLGDGEFYLDYGTFDVSLEVPEGWLVAASGELQNAEEVLPESARARLSTALASDSTLRIAEASDLTTSQTPGAFTTWRFRAEQVRDFAFAASRRYVWDAVGADVGGERGRALVHALYDPTLEHWSAAAAYAKHALEFFSREFFPYPYSHATAAFGPIGGMEYPMMVFMSPVAAGEDMYGVIAHELAHQWFPMLVGSREAAYAWMDEGFSTYAGTRAATDLFENEVARVRDGETYRQVAAAELEVPLMRHTDFVKTEFARGVAAYEKPATLLHSLRRTLGEEVFDRAFRAYAEAWSYKHPYPWDFFAMVETETGQDLDWFWRPWFYDTATLDQAIEGVVPAPAGVRITVSNRGGAVMPVELWLEFEDETVERIDWPVDVWKGTRRVTRIVTASKPVARVLLDPQRFYLDTDRRNNTWPELRLEP